VLPHLQTTSGQSAYRSDMQPAFEVNKRAAPCEHDIVVITSALPVAPHTLTGKLSPGTAAHIFK